MHRTREGASHESLSGSQRKGLCNQGISFLTQRSNSAQSEPAHLSVLHFNFLSCMGLGQPHPCVGLRRPPFSSPGIPRSCVPKAILGLRSVRTTENRPTGLTASRPEDPDKHFSFFLCKQPCQSRVAIILEAASGTDEGVQYTGWVTVPDIR